MAIAHLPPFATLLRRHRLEAELTQEALAEKAGLSARAISDLERGVKTKPHRATVELLSDALSLSPDEREELLAAVPGINGSATGVADPLPDRIVESFLAQNAGARAMAGSHDLRRALEGLVGLYLEKQSLDLQVNIAVLIFSVGDQASTS